MRNRWMAWCGLVPILLMAWQARAAEVCDLPPRYGLAPVAVAITRVACEEHRQWLRPFIDRNGRLASLRVTEAESGYLADHGVVAWQRTASYWREAGTLDAVADLPGAASCAQPYGSRYTDSDCRAFLVDTPWSATFVSWVMTRAGLAGFHRSPRHMDYIRSAWRDAATGPYRLVDPASEKPEPGDLLCFIRGRSQALGHAGLLAALAGRGPVPAQSHCDIVIAANVGGDRTLYLIGGNVLNAVTMRKLELDRTGRLVLPAAAPQSAQGEAETTAPGAECTPGHEELCDFNRQDWAALLKLQVPAAQAAP